MQEKCVVVYAYNSSTLGPQTGGPEVQDHLQLHSKFKTSRVFYTKIKKQNNFIHAKA